MSDDGRKEGRQATSADTLEEQIMSATLPKNEREWWAKREIERLQAECLRLSHAEAEAMAVVLSQEEQIKKWKRAADEGHPQPCALGPNCPYCEIARLRAELAEKTRLLADKDGDIIDLQIEVEALRADAERYRALRGNKSLRIDYYDDDLDRWLDENCGPSAYHRLAKERT